ncbi:MAG: hypothetical protein GY847_24605 [Proteobacteria bacterium]|nr:hypothetical protein [Pseudomonadota bacterium]
MKTASKIAIGVDLGKATVSLATGIIAEDGTIYNIRTRFERHSGAPLDVFRRFYRDIDNIAIQCMAATGVFSSRLKEPVISDVPEEIAQEIAAKKLHDQGGPLNIVRLGARGYSILTLDKDDNIRFEENDKCSSGTGETIEKICGRLGVSLEEAIQSAGSVKESIPISARCSVFAKSEMTHFANQGEPHQKLLKGYFESIARNLFSLYEKNKVPGPVILIGNGALISPVYESFAKMCTFPVRVSPKASAYEAIGAMYLAAERAGEGRVGASSASSFPDDPNCLIAEKQKRIERLEPASTTAKSVIHLEDNRTDIPPDAIAVLGIDLGSTGSKATLIDLCSGEMIADLYRRTNGNPVEAAKALVASMAQMTDHKVVAIGLTGSGRYAAATVFRAAYPELDSHIYVQDEIVAHATAAMKYDDQKGRSLSIVEIGGQDAKFINIQGGRVVESDLNRACSAGTGSFLEEQGLFYGIQEIDRFGPMAATAKSPPNLGQMCTVFVADQANEALSEGYTLEDLLAGFQYSVIHNYKNRVMGNRQFMDRIFFQGMPATNSSLAQTLSAVTNREVIVPPNPGAMGALGIAMLARDQIDGLDDAKPFDLNQILETEITSRRKFRCKDKKCQNLCRIESATVSVRQNEKKVISGGSCPKYEEVSAGHKKLPKDAPNPYREREEVLNSILVSSKNQSSDWPSVGVPYGHTQMEFLPFFYTLLKELGLRVNVIRSDKETFAIGNNRSSANNTCTPVKIMHGLSKTDFDYLFLPKIVSLPRDRTKAGTSPCTMTQSAPEMIEKALEAEGAEVEVLRPVLHMADGLNNPSLFGNLWAMFNKLPNSVGKVGCETETFFNAYRQALEHQQSYTNRLFEIGRRALEFAKKSQYPVVLVTGNSHVIHEPIMNAKIHEIVSQNGAVPLPLDCFPISESIPPLERVYWTTSNRVLRASVQAMRHGFVFPVLIASYGCGPSSFLEHLFNDLLEDYPHTILESDGHGGKAGYITRIQAYLHSARNYLKDGKKGMPFKKIKWLDKFPVHSPQKLESSKISIFTVGPTMGAHFATILRNRGFDADFSGLTEPDGFKRSRETCSGKECLPYQLIWGSFRKYLDENPPEEGKSTLLFTITGSGPCRNGMFTLGNELTLRKMGLDDKVGLATFGSFSYDRGLFSGIGFSIVITDLLNQMRLHYRPIEHNLGESDQLFNKYMNEVEDFLCTIKKGRMIFDIRRHLRALKTIVFDAAMAFRAISTIEELEQQARTVLLSGDMYLRIDEWGSDELARKLNKQGLHVVLEPFHEAIEGLALYNSTELIELEHKWLRNRKNRMMLNFFTTRLYKTAKQVLPWITNHHIRDIDKESRELVDSTPFNEAIFTIGNSLLSWRTGQVDGIVVVGPWGCGPSLISEAQLRRRTDIPFLFVYNDGDPIDEAKIAGFAWRLKRRAPRQKP